LIQLIVARDGVTSIWLPGRTRVGEAVWVGADAARHLLENGICAWPGGEKGTGPLERPAAGPQHAPEAGPTETPEAKPDVVPEVAAAEAKKSGPIRRPAGWPVDRFSVVERAWAGETVLCIGGGPSLAPAAIAAARGRCRAIAINNSYGIAPWAEICYFADARWWEWHKDKPEFRAFRGQKVTIGDGTGMMVSDPAVHMLHNYGADGLSEQPNGLHTGSNSGYQAVNIAVLAGAGRILLAGYDMKFAGARSHWHGGHPTRMPEDAYTRYATRFASMLPQLARLGTRVINCTPGSAITCFPFSTLEAELA